MPDPVADPRQFPDATDLAAAIAEQARPRKRSPGVTSTAFGDSTMCSTRL